MSTEKLVFWIGEGNRKEREIAFGLGFVNKIVEKAAGLN
jgi:hypothetical protein